MKSLLKTRMFFCFVIFYTGAAGATERLSFSTWRGIDAEFYQSIFSDYEARTGTQIELVAFPSIEYESKLGQLLSSGNGPDIIHSRADWQVAKFSNFYLPITESEIPGINSFPIGALDSMKGQGGLLYGVPFATQTFLILYNKTLFAQYGQEEPQTWNDFLAICELFKKKGIIPLANGLGTPWHNEAIFGGLFPSSLGRRFEEDLREGRTNFRDPRFTNALVKLYRMRSFLPTNYATLESSSAKDLFASAGAAMIVGGSFELSDIQKRIIRLGKVHEVEIDVFASPVENASDQQLVATLYDGGFAINRKLTGTKQAAAIEFVHFLSSVEFAQPFSDTLLNISPVPGVEIKNSLLKKISDMNHHSISYFGLCHFLTRNPQRSTLLKEMIYSFMTQEMRDDATAPGMNLRVITQRAQAIGEAMTQEIQLKIADYMPEQVAREWLNHHTD